MDDTHGGGRDRSAAEELVLRTVAAHAESLLRTARRHSLCLDDAQDAYQRTLEIFMANADRLDPARAPAWLHVVVKREAQAIRKSRQRLVTTDEVNLDERESPSVTSPEEHVLTLDKLTRAAEALKRLKPQELRALWLKAQGHSYSDIGAITGWSYTKVNRCVAEGRRAFLERYAGIESGEECLRWRPVISAMVDGEATPEQIVELRPHLRNCPGCRATLKALQESHEPLAALFPIPLVALDAGTGEHVTSLLVRLYEGFTGGIHERAVHSATKVQTAIEAATSGKIAAVAASAAAAAGGGLATVERVVRPESERSAKEVTAERVVRASAKESAAPTPAPVPVAAPPAPVPVAPPPPPVAPVAAPHEPAPAPTASTSASEFDLEPQVHSSHQEFGDPGGATAAVTESKRTRSPATSQATAASEFGP